MYYYLYMILLRVICILLLLYSTAFSRVNGSLGALVDQGSKSLNLAGVFIEVNSQKYGGYLSFTGMSEDTFSDRLHSFTHVNLGMTYFVKKKLGFLVHGGVFNEMYQKYSIPKYRFYKNIPGNNPIDDGGGDSNLIEWNSKSYFTYGGGLLFYTMGGNVTLHLKVSYIPKLRGNVFVGIGIGIHFG